MTAPLPYTRAANLPALLRERILILDGAMGTMIQRYKLLYHAAVHYRLLTRAQYHHA